MALWRRKRTREQLQADLDAWILKGRIKAQKERFNKAKAIALLESQKARTPVKKRRPGPPRRGRVLDPKYMAWLATQPPLVSGPGRMTIHHVRRLGEQKDDRRTVPLPASLHLIQEGPHFSIEALGKAKFEARFGVDLEAAILAYNDRYREVK